MGFSAKGLYGLVPGDWDLVKAFVSNSISCAFSSGCDPASVGPSTSVPGQVLKQDPNKRLADEIEIKITGMQASLISQAMGQSANNPPNWNMPGGGCDCATWAQQMMAAGGMESGPPTPIPGALMSQLAQIYGGP